MKSIIQSKRAQEEIVGFVIIVIIVTIAAFILISIYLRNNSQDSGTESTDALQFLESMMQYTSSCAISYEPAFLSMSNLIQECHSGNSRCLTGEKACEHVSSSISRIIETSLAISNQSYVRGYDFKAVYDLQGSAEKEVLWVSEGDCTGTIKGAETIIRSSRGTITVTLKICN